MDKSCPEAQDSHRVQCPAFAFLDSFLERRCYDLRMRAELRDMWLAAILILEAVVSIGFAPAATAHGGLANARRKGRAVGSELALAEALEKEIAAAPASVESWTKRADLLLERFRVLELKLRSSESGLAVMLRLQAAGLRSGQETREELLRQSATADPEQQGIWGELGAEQVRRGRLKEAATTLETAEERQPTDLWTLRLEAVMAAVRADWKEAERWLLEVGSRSPAMFREEMQGWPRNLVPPQNVAGEIWKCAREKSATGLEKLQFPASKSFYPEEQLFDEQRWEQLAALPEPPQGKNEEGTIYRAPPNSLPENYQASAWFRRGVAFAELRDCARAIPALERGLDAGAETAAYWLELCYASEAELAVGRLGDFGGQAVFHRVRGDFLVRVKGDMQAATEEYKKARQLDPRDPAPAERLAQAYEHIGDMPRAKQVAGEALALDPHRVVSLRLLASIAMNERDYPNALDFLNKLLAQRPNDAWTRVQLGITYAQTGQPQEALANLQPPLAAGYPDERGALHAMLARVLRKLGREQEAQSAAAESNRLSNLFQQHGSKGVDDHQ